MDDLPPHEVEGEDEIHGKGCAGRGYKRWYFRIPGPVGGKRFMKGGGYPDLSMPALSGRELVSLCLQVLCGVTMGAILMDVLKDAINPLIIYVIIIATIIAILDFAEYLPAFSIAFFTGYAVEFLSPFTGIFDGFEIPALALSLIGMAVVVAMKLRYPKGRQTL
jgi:hypothetical protein